MGQVMVPLEGKSPKVADVVIVGGGIVGVSSAFFCSRAGLKVVVVEKGEALGSLTTASSTECFRAIHLSPILRHKPCQPLNTRLGEPFCVFSTSRAPRISSHKYACL